VLCTFASYEDISGVPGVGKTVAVNEIIRKQKLCLNKQKVKFGFINAMTLKRPSDIYNIILNIIQGEEVDKKKGLSLDNTIVKLDEVLAK
jgi:Cdc6-like AAA superfamily ATPase